MTASASWTAWSCSVRVTVEHDDALARASRVVADLMADVDRAVSRFRPDSDLARVNRHAGRLVPVSSLTVTLVGVGLDAATDSGGLVDPTLADALRRAGYDDDLATIRERASGHLVEPARTGRWRDVRVDRGLRLVGAPAGAGLDLGATAKAWTAQEGARRVHDVVGGAALVEIGGDLAAAGTPGRAWRIDVAETEGAPAQRVDLSGGGLATSSVLARRWRTRDGQEAHHLLDPRTGLPVDGPWRTATVWAPDAVQANVGSTAAVILGVQAGPWLRERGLSARLVDRAGRVSTVGSWPAEEAIAS